VERHLERLRAGNGFAPAALTLAQQLEGSMYAMFIAMVVFDVISIATYHQFAIRRERALLRMEQRLNDKSWHRKFEQ
jgi:hypothetical protein